MGKYLKKYKSPAFRRKSARVIGIRLGVLVVLLLAANYLINVGLPVNSQGLSVRDREDLRNITAYRVQKQEIIWNNLKDLILEGFASKKLKTTMLAYSQWMHLVVLQNQVRYEPAKVNQYHEEISFYRETKLFEITTEQDKEIEEHKDRGFAEAWRKLVSLEFEESWNNLDSSLSMVGLQLQTTVNPHLKPYAGNPSKRTGRVLQWYDAISAVAKKYELEPALVAALMEQESGGNPNAISRAGAIGLMQLMPKTARGLGVNPFDPVQNLEGGAKYIKLQLDRFGNLPDALVAYNAGPSRVGKPLFSETQGYVHSVPRLIEKYRPYFQNRRTINLKPLTSRIIR